MCKEEKERGKETNGDSQKQMKGRKCKVRATQMVGIGKGGKRMCICIECELSSYTIITVVVLIAYLRTRIRTLVIRMKEKKNIGIESAMNVRRVHSFGERVWLTRASSTDSQ